jgi:hypothetical protein
MAQVAAAHALLEGAVEVLVIGALIASSIAFALETSWYAGQTVMGLQHFLPNKIAIHAFQAVGPILTFVAITYANLAKLWFGFVVVHLPALLACFVVRTLGTVRHAALAGHAQTVVVVAWLAGGAVWRCTGQAERNHSRTGLAEGRGWHVTRVSASLACHPRLGLPADLTVGNVLLTCQTSKILGVVVLLALATVVERFRCKPLGLIAKQTLFWNETGLATRDWASDLLLLESAWGQREGEDEDGDDRVEGWHIWGINN